MKERILNIVMRDFNLSMDVVKGSYGGITMVYGREMWTWNRPKIATEKGGN